MTARVRRPQKAQREPFPASLRLWPAIQAVNGRVVAVGAVDRNGAMPTFSNRAGSTASYYLLAPGVQVITAGVDDDVRSPGANGNDADTDGDYWAASGTSFAAPHVAGALALMLDLFPNITPRERHAGAKSADDYVTSTPDAVLGVSAGPVQMRSAGAAFSIFSAHFRPWARRQ